MSIFGQMFLQNLESAWATDAMDSMRQKLAIRDTEIAELREQVTLLRDVMSRIAFTRTGKCIDLAQELFDREDWATEALAATEQKP